MSAVSPQDDPQEPGSRPPVRLPDMLLRAVERELASSVKTPPRRHIEALEELFTLFTSERSRVQGFRYLDVLKFRHAYLRYHLPLNAARASFALGEVRRAHPGVGDLTDVVDLGAGPGSASLATYLAEEPPRARRYLLVDRSQQALKVARRLFQSCAEERHRRGSGSEAAAAVTTRVSHLPRLPPLPRRALVWLGMVLNEIGVGAPRGPSPSALLQSLARRLDTPSVVIITEPAQRRPGRHLLAIHDAAVAAGDWTVLAPCTHQQACPLLRARGASWCHFRFPWTAPQLAQEAAHILGLDIETPSVSYLALRRGAPPAGGPARRNGRARVIGDAMALKNGGSGVYICSDGERRLLRVDRQPPRRGDILRPEDV